MNVYSLAVPEIAVASRGATGQTDPLAEVPDAFEVVEGWPGGEDHPRFQTQESTGQPHAVGFAESLARVQVGAPVSVTTETTARQTAAPKGWLSRIRRVVKAGGEWVADQRTRAAYTIGLAATAMTVGESKEALDALEVRGTLGGVMKGFIELITNTQASEHMSNAGALSAASVSVIGLGLIMRKNSHKRDRTRPGEVGLGELMAPRQVQSVDHAAFEEHLAHYQRIIDETNNEIRGRAAGAYAVA